MSKLEAQKALPRRNLYIARTQAMADAIRAVVHPDDTVEVVRVLRKVKRKAKKAKAKR